MARIRMSWRTWYRWDEFLQEEYVAPYLAHDMSANRLTFWTLVLALAGAAVLALGSPVLGALLWGAGRSLDHADGRIASIHGTDGRLGMLWDHSVGVLSCAALYAAIGIYTGLPEWVWVSAMWLAGVCRWVELSSDTSFQKLEESGDWFLHMGYDEAWAPYYWLLPLFALAPEGLLAYLGAAMAGAVAWTVMVLAEAYFRKPLFNK